MTVNTSLNSTNTLFHQELLGPYDTEENCRLACLQLKTYSESIHRIHLPAEERVDYRENWNIELVKSKWFIIPAEDLQVNTISAVAQRSLPQPSIINNTSASPMRVPISRIDRHLPEQPTVLQQRSDRRSASREERRAARRAARMVEEANLSESTTPLTTTESRPRLMMPLQNVQIGRAGTTEVYGQPCDFYKLRVSNEILNFAYMRGRLCHLKLVDTGEDVTLRIVGSASSEWKCLLVTPVDILFIIQAGMDMWKKTSRGESSVSLKDIMEFTGLPPRTPQGGTVTPKVSNSELERICDVTCEGETILLTPREDKLNDMLFVKAKKLLNILSNETNHLYFLVRCESLPKRNENQSPREPLIAAIVNGVLYYTDPDLLIIEPRREALKERLNIEYEKLPSAKKAALEEEVCKIERGIPNLQ
jgi:hypothetical protein